MIDELMDGKKGKAPPFGKKGAPPPEAGGDDFAAEISAGDSEVAAATSDAIGAGAPPASAPLSPERVNRLSQAIGMAVEALSVGEAPAPPLEDVTDPQDAVPGPVYAQLRTIIESLKASGVRGVEKYELDVDEAVTSERGLEQAIMVLTKASQDERLIDALSGGPKHGKGMPEEGSEEAPEGSEPPPEVAEKPVKDELEGLI